MINTITLNRKQAEQFAQIVNHFKETEYFDIVSDNTNGIGPTVRVSFDLFNIGDIQVDITDAESW